MKKKIAPPKSQSKSQSKSQPKSQSQNTHILTVSQRLEEAYGNLKQRMDGINSNLEETSEELFHKIYELNTLTNYLNTILAAISQGVLFIDFEGKITTYNSACEKILKIPSKKLLFSNFQKHFPDDYFGFSIQEAIKKKEGGKALVSIKNGEGNKREIEVDVVIVEETCKSSPLQGLLICLKDATEIRELERQAHRKSKMNELGEMVSVIAHELRNPLGGIKGFASLLERDLKDNPELAKMASYIVKGTENLNNLVTRALSYSRPQELQLKETNINHLLKETADLVRQDPSLKKRVEFKITLPEKEITGIVDRDRLKSALLNLIMNGFQATPEGGAVTVELQQKSDTFVICVKDTGIGITEENLKKIFSPFFTTRQEGNGLGLSEVHKTVQMHEGTIKVESVVDQGTEFTISLPLYEKF